MKKVWQTTALKPATFGFLTVLIPYTYILNKLATILLTTLNFMDKISKKTKMLTPEFHRENSFGRKKKQIVSSNPNNLRLLKFEIKMSKTCLKALITAANNQSDETKVALLESVLVWLQILFHWRHETILEWRHETMQFIAGFSALLFCEKDYLYICTNIFS